MCSTVEAALEAFLAAVGGPDEEVLALVDLADRVKAALVERVGAFDASAGWAADGSFSFACWLRARADVDRAESRRLEALARTLRTMPVTAAAVRDGKLSVAKARVLASVINERTVARFNDEEAFLVEQVQGLSVDHAKTALAYWKRLADTDGPDPSDPGRNRASLTVGYGGRWHLDADLDPVGGAILRSVLEAIQDRMHQDGRFADLSTQANTSGHRTAQALVELAHRGSGSDPNQVAVHPDVIVTVPVHALTSGHPDPFDPPTVIGAGPVTLVDVLRLAVLGTIATMALDGTGRPLNLGRKVRLANGDQWIASTIRDRECVVPGCERPAAWCHLHHLTFWSHGGPTDLENLGMACARHHHLIHDRHWGLSHLPDGSWQLTRPDGTIVAPPRYPGSQRPPPADG